MAKYRMINTKLWSDGWVRGLNPLDRYLFLFLLTNEHTNLCGIYELPLSMMAFESGIDERDLEKTMLPRLAPKVHYVDGWVYIVNFAKHHPGTGKTEIGVNNAKAEIPASIMGKIEKIDQKNAPYMPHRSPSGSSASALASTLALASHEGKPTPAQEAQDFFSLGETYGKTVQRLVEKGYSEKTVRNELGKFIDYWTELNSTGTKQLWQLKKTFEVGRRLKTWFSKDGKFGGSKGSKFDVGTV
jgi:hypothetical protein